MRIRKNENLIIFFDVFFCVILCILTSIGFFLGFELTKINTFYYLLTIISIIIFCTLLYLIFLLTNKTFYLFTNLGITLIKKQKEIQKINICDIGNIYYCKIYHLLFGNPRGGLMFVYDINNKEVMRIPISSRNIHKIQKYQVLNRFK